MYGATKAPTGASGNLSSSGGKRKHQCRRRLGVATLERRDTRQGRKNAGRDSFAAPPSTKHSIVQQRALATEACGALWGAVEPHVLGAPLESPCLVGSGAHQATRIRKGECSCECIAGLDQPVCGEGCGRGKECEQSGHSVQKRDVVGSVETTLPRLLHEEEQQLKRELGLLGAGSDGHPAPGEGRRCWRGGPSRSAPHCRICGQVLHPGHLHGKAFDRGGAGTWQHIEEQVHGVADTLQAQLEGLLAKGAMHPGTCRQGLSCAGERWQEIRQWGGPPSKNPVGGGATHHQHPAAALLRVPEP